MSKCMVYDCDVVMFFTYIIHLKMYCFYAVSKSTLHDVLDPGLYVCVLFDWDVPRRVGLLSWGSTRAEPEMY